MLLLSLLLIPLIGIFIISTVSIDDINPSIAYQEMRKHPDYKESSTLNLIKPQKILSAGPIKSADRIIKNIALSISIINLFISIIIFLAFNFSTNQFQFVQEQYKISSFDFYLGVDGISIYFVVLTTIIMPVALLSN